MEMYKVIYVVLWLFRFRDCYHTKDREDIFRQVKLELIDDNVAIPAYSDYLSNSLLSEKIDATRCKT